MRTNTLPKRLLVLFCLFGIGSGVFAGCGGSECKCGTRPQTLYAEAKKIEADAKNWAFKGNKEFAEALKKLAEAKKKTAKAFETSTEAFDKAVEEYKKVLEEARALAKDVKRPFSSKKSSKPPCEICTCGMDYYQD